MASTISRMSAERRGVGDEPGPAAAGASAEFGAKSCPATLASQGEASDDGEPSASSTTASSKTGGSSGRGAALQAGPASSGAASHRSGARAGGGCTSGTASARAEGKRTHAHTRLVNEGKRAPHTYPAQPRALAAAACTPWRQRRARRAPGLLGSCTGLHTLQQPLWAGVRGGGDAGCPRGRLARKAPFRREYCGVKAGLVPKLPFALAGRTTTQRR